MLYIGPDALMPLASAIAAAFGMALMFWRRIMAAVRVGFRTLTRRNSAKELDS